MNEAEFDRYSGVLLGYVMESLGEIVANQAGPRVVSRGPIIHLSIYDNIGAQLGQAVAKQVDDAADELVGSGLLWQDD